MLNIVFGSIKKNGGSKIAEQAFDFPVITMEANRGPKTSRRILFNRPAMKLLEMEDGEVNEMLFGFASGEDNRLFIVNTAEFIAEVEDKTYKTSKNKAAYTNSKERGKAISSNPLSTEIMSFMSIASDDVDTNFKLTLYSDEGEANVYELESFSAESDTFDLSEDKEFSEDAASLEMNEIAVEAPVEYEVADEPVGMPAEEVVSEEEPVTTTDSSEDIPVRQVFSI